MVKPVIRNKSVGTKVTEEEYAQLEALAGGRSMGEWVRETLLETVSRTKATPAEEAILAEVLGLRTLFLNMVFKLAKGEAATVAEMQAWIDRADAEKERKAAERLAAR